MNVPAAFLTDVCVGMREEKGVYVYQFESQDGMLILGNGEEVSDIAIEMQNPAAISWPVNTGKQTGIKFEHPEDGAVKDSTFKMDLDDSVYSNYCEGKIYGRQDSAIESI